MIDYQESLWPPYQKHSDTSRDAAESIADRLTDLQCKVLSFIASCPLGVTDEEGTDALEMNPSTYRPRRIELLDRQQIKPAGKRKTRSGRNATVWKVK